MLSKLSLAVIAVYQKFISPKKGYRCSYGVLHGTHGCSGHVKHIIQKKGIFAGMPEIKAQFANCKSASIELGRRKDKKRKDNKKDSKCDDALECCDPGGCDICDILNIFN